MFFFFIIVASFLIVCDVIAKGHGRIMTPENLRKLFERIVAVRTFNKVYDENSMLDVPMYLNMPTHFDGTNTTAMHYDDERVSIVNIQC